MLTKSSQIAGFLSRGPRENDSFSTPRTVWGIRHSGCSSPILSPGATQGTKLLGC
jgi:hypothetical protein